MNSTHEDCKLVVFSNKAWNAIVNETFRKDPVETGGILLGHILSNGCWIVIEMVPPGLKAIHQKAYFEYDTEFVNYMANSLSKLYKIELSVLGLWHRHPGSMDVFSGTDDGTNATFAQMNQYGAISGLVNIDPKFRFTLRHVAYPLHYQIVDFEVGDDIVPPQYFELKYPSVENIVPHVSAKGEESPHTPITEPEHDINSGTPSTSHEESNKTTSNDYILKADVIKLVKRGIAVVVIAAISLATGLWIGHKNSGEKPIPKDTTGVEHVVVDTNTTTVTEPDTTENNNPNNGGTRAVKAAKTEVSNTKKKGANVVSEEIQSKDSIETVTGTSETEKSQPTEEPIKTEEEKREGPH